jgi:hypothetical protein
MRRCSDLGWRELAEAPASEGEEVMGEFTHAMRNPIRERDDQIKALESVLRRAYEYIETQGVFDPPGSESVTLRLDIMAALQRRFVMPSEADEKVRTLHAHASDYMKCASRDCWLCHGTPENAGPR